MLRKNKSLLRPRTDVRPCLPVEGAAPTDQLTER